MIDRRKDIRASKRIPLKLADPTFDVITETVDISPSGAYCRVTRNLPPMSKIEVVLLVPGKDSESPTRKIRCRGVVVRTEPAIIKDTDKAHYNIAIFFTDISKRDRKIAEDYVTSGSMDPAEIHINQ